MTESAIDDLNLVSDKLYVFIENNTDSAHIGCTFEIETSFEPYQGTWLEIYVLKRTEMHMYDCSSIFLNKLEFSRLDSKINQASLNTIEDSLALLNISPFLSFHNKYKLSFETIDNKRYAKWDGMDLDSNKPLGINPAFFELLISVPTKYDFIFQYENNDTKLVNKDFTYITFSSSAENLDTTLLFNFSNLIDPLIKFPLHIRLNTNEIPHNMFINPNNYGSTLNSFVSLGTINPKHDITFSNRTGYDITLNKQNYTQCWELQIVDSNLKVLEMPEGNYCIVRINILI